MGSLWCFASFFSFPAKQRVSDAYLRVRESPEHTGVIIQNFHVCNYKFKVAVRGWGWGWGKPEPSFPSLSHLSLLPSASLQVLVTNLSFKTGAVLFCLFVCLFSGLLV